MKWVGGLAEWVEGDTAYLSVAFTWKIPEAIDRAAFARAQGLKVVAGGPALFRPPVDGDGKFDSPFVAAKRRLGEIADIQLQYPDAVLHHNPEATFASRGCTEKCSFCIVPALEGDLAPIPEFVPRPVLCDNNLSALPAEYQDYIIARYTESGVKLRDANSGFEPKTFTPDVYARWKRLIKSGGGPWRFGYDSLDERPQVLRVMKMLAGEPQSRKRVYVLVGNEPFGACMQRIRDVIANGCEPHVQPFMKLNALERVPHVRFDWTLDKLRRVARWSNLRTWKYCEFADFNPNRPGHRPERYDAQQGLFL